MNFVSPIVFEILKFKNLAIWLAELIFAFNSRNRFFPDMQFWQNHKAYGAWFRPKKATHQLTIFFFFFFQNSRNLSWGVLGNYPQNKTFSKKSSSVSFLLLRHPNFMRSFRKILWAMLEKTRLLTDILKYWEDFKS